MITAADVSPLMYGLDGLARAIEDHAIDNLEQIGREVRAFSNVALDLYEKGADANTARPAVAE